MEQDELGNGADPGPDLQHGPGLAQADEPRQVAERKGRGDAMRTGLPTELMMNVPGDEEVVSTGDQLHRAPAPLFSPRVSRQGLAARAGAWIAISLKFLNRRGCGQPVGTCAPWRPIVIQGQGGSNAGPRASKVMLTIRPGRLSSSLTMAP